MKNNLTLLAREGKAKSLQNTGGGASQQSTAQHDSARVFKYFNTQMARFLWNKKGEATVSKSSCSWAQGRATSSEQPTNHALITHLSPTQTVSLARIWKYVACLLIAFFVGVGNVWGANGDVLFTQNFNSATASAYGYTSGTVTLTHTWNTTSTLEGLVGSGSNLFTSITSSIKKGDIAINSSTGGGSVDATGFFQAYSNGDNAGYWSLTRTADFAATAPTAIKVSMDIWYLHLASGSNRGVYFAVGDGFADGLVSTSSQATDKVHSGFCILNNAVPALTEYGSTTKIYSTGITESTWLTIVWIINNTGDILEYDNPTGSGKTELANDKFDVWVKTQAGAASTFNKIVSAQAATTAAKDLQNIHIGNHNNSSAKHHFCLDNVVVTDLTPAAAASYTITYNNNGGSGSMSNSTNTVSTCTFTAPEGKEFKEWNTAANGSGATWAAGATATSNLDLYAIWQNQAPKYSVTYVMNGASGDAPTQASVAAGTEITLAAAQTWTDHTFLGWLCDIDSEVKTAETSYTMTAANTTFTAQWKVNAPVITFNNATGAVSIAAAAGATIKYSLDGSDPTSGTTYSESFTIDEDKTVKAVAIQSGHTTSDVASKSCVLCHEPATLTNEIARFFVPCGVTSGSYNVTDQASSTGDNTFTTDGFGSSWDFKETGWAYGKLNGNSNYIEITLNSGTFKAGDVVYGYFSSNSANNNLKLHASDGNALGAASASGLVDGEYVRSLTLVAADIEEGGSIKFFRAESAIRVNRIIVTREPPCVGDPGDISKGTLSAGVLTLNAAGTPLSGDTWYWQSSSTGTDQTNSGTSYGVSAAGTYYVRSYNATGTCWSDAKSITVTAADLVENFTVVFKDGETTLGSETVEVGEHPSAAGISTTKEFYTFAAWQESGVDKALNDVSAANGETVTLTARYTGNYAYGTYLFNSLTMGSTISKTITTEEVVYNDAFRVDNFYFAAGIKIQGEIGTAEETTTLTNYKGWKLKTNAKTIKFLVENNSQVKVAIGEKTGIQVTYTPLVGAETTASQAKDNETAYSVKGGTVVTITTTSDNTTTLKRLSISNLYNVTYTDGTGDASGSASNVPEVTLPTPTETTVTVETVDYSFAGWKANQAVTVNDVVKSAGTLLKAGDVAVLGANTTFTAQWAVVVPKYTITKGSHTNGDFTISVAEQEAGETVTLTATPNEDYVFSAWAVVKTEDGSATGITVSNNTFSMPAYGVTVNATFAADPRSKVLYVTSNTADATKSDDKVYAALKDTYNVKIVGPTSDADQSGYALVVLHESLNGGNDYNATAVAAAKTGTTPVLNTKAYFYNSGRWAWGTPNAGKKTKGVHVNTSYCNITSHPLFNDLTPDANDSIIILSSISGDNKPIQPIGSFTSGKEGYTLANVPDGCAIHELTPAQRGAESGKYLLISLYTKDFANLNANGQKLFQNAAAYLIGNTAWEPINALTSPAVAASPSTAYSVGDNIALTASATGSSAATTYTWYKGDTWAAAEEAGAIQAAATAAAGGNTYGITGCALGDAGTYWCVISNGTGCDAKASLEITVSDIAYDITFVSAHGTAPTATTGVSYTLPELSAEGWEHQGWTASIDVTVDAATVTAGTKIANGKIATFAADVEFTAVWAEVFDVTFNMQSHGASIAAQHIVDGGKATEPNDPSAIGWDFGGWFTDAECTVGNEFDFNTDISEDTELFAKWTAFAGCTELWPATSGDAPAAVGDAIVMQTGSNGASMTVEAKPDKLTYTSSGLQFGSTSGVKVNVVLNNDMTVGTKILLTLVSSGTGARGLDLYNAAGSAKIATLGWSSATNGEEKTFTYTVVAEDGLDGTNAFQLWRNNTVYLKSLKVESCGDAIIYHDLTSAISPDHDPAYATVTLGASSVREGRTTTAEYSAINAAYEFDEWQISGTGATLSSTTANPVTITMGTADAVVTLKLKAATPKHTVTFNKMGKGDDIDDQEVKEGDLVEEPTVTEPEGWILEGWYTENTFDTKWDFANDVMSTSDIELFANWVADTSIKLLSGSTVNHTNFITGTNETTVEIESVEHKCVDFTTAGSNRTTVASISDLKEFIQYNATTNKAKMKLTLYNTNSSAVSVYLHMLEEGDETATTEEISVPAGEILKTDFYEFNSEKNRSFYITCGNRTYIKVLQVKVIDDGTTTLKKAGQVGYSVNTLKSRIFAPQQSAISFEGLTVNANAVCKPLSTTALKIKNAYNISFHADVDMTLAVTTEGNQTYYVSAAADGTTNETSFTGRKEFEITAGDWYIHAGSSELKVAKLEFIAPKCAEPAFNALANSELCEGAAFVALDGTATVADAGTPIYQWYNADGDAAIDGATSATYTPTADGSYYVIATNQLSGYTDNEKKSATVTVTHYASAAITTAPEDVRKDVGEEATLSVVATGKNLSYEWFTCDDAEGTNPVAIVPAETGASLTVTITAGMYQYYKVVVSSDCGVASAVAKVEEWKALPQLKVSTTTTWDWAYAATATIAPEKDVEILMANIKDGVKKMTNNETFNSQALLFQGQEAYAVESSRAYAKGGHIKFTTTVPGKVTVEFSDNGNNNRRLKINNALSTENSSSKTDVKTFSAVVPAGEVVLMGVNDDGTGVDRYIRISKIIFSTTDVEGANYTRDVTQGYYGTICLPNGGIMVGATLFELAYFDPSKKKIFCDEIVSGEMVAGTPYIFLPLEGASQLGVYYTDAANEDAGHANGLFGSYVQAVIPANGENYILYNNQYCLVNSTAYVGAYRAYIKLEGDDAAPREENPAAAKPKQGRRRVAMSAYGEQVATGMDGVQGEGVPYQKVMIDGQLYIMRDGRIYNATGIMVK